MKQSFHFQAYGNDLNEAKKWCTRYRSSVNIRDLNQAWDLYYHVFRRISRQLPQLTQLELQYVSPKLLLCRDLELAVPGSYVPNTEVSVNQNRFFRLLRLVQVVATTEKMKWAFNWPIFYVIDATITLNLAKQKQLNAEPVRDKHELATSLTTK